MHLNLKNPSEKLSFTRFSDFSLVIEMFSAMDNNTIGLIFGLGADPTTPPASAINLHVKTEFKMIFGRAERQALPQSKIIKNRFR